jgi:superfamily II DNA helicase RecQ
MDKVNCQQKMIAEYFGVPSKEKCGRCGNCLSPVISVAVDNTLHAKQLVTCLQNMQMLKEKVSVDELAGTYIGSQGALVKNKKFDQVPAYGKGKGHFKSVSHLTGFIYYLIINGMFVENLRDEQDRVKSTFVSLGNVRELLGGNINVLY